MKKEQQIYLAISATAIVTGLVLSITYRPHVYENSINDFGLADTIGSLVSVVGSFFFLAGIKTYTAKEKNKMIVSLTLVYGVVWEILGLLNLHGTFDWKDIVATFISGGITYLLKELLDWKRTKYNPSSHDHIV